jgi:hypothetical protein
VESLFKVLNVLEVDCDVERCKSWRNVAFSEHGMPVAGKTKTIKHPLVYPTVHVHGHDRARRRRPGAGQGSHQRQPYGTVGVHPHAMPVDGKR